MARVLAMAALAACIVFLCQTGPVQGRVIVRRQVEESTTVVATANEEVEMTTTMVVPTSKVATTPPRPNDRFEQFPIDGATSEGISTGSGVSDSEDTMASLSETAGSGVSDSEDTMASLSETAGSDSDDNEVTTLAPASEQDTKESQGSGPSASEDDSASLMSRSTVELSSSAASGTSSQLSESDVSDDREDSTALPTESVVVNEITTPAPTVAPVQADEPESESVASASASGSSGSYEPGTSEAEPSGESVAASQSTTSGESQSLGETNEVRQVPAVTELPIAATQAPPEDPKIADEVSTDATVDSGTERPESDQSEVETVRPDVSTGGATNVSVDEASETERFDLSRYSSPSNFSEGGIALNGSSASSATTGEESSDLAEINEASTEESVPATTVSASVASEDVSLDGIRVNETVETNSSQSLERSQLESTTYEFESNEVNRNQTQAGPLPTRTKKGKFLDVVNEETTEDNDINGAAWALAGMRMVERKQSDAGQAVSESTEVVRDSGENVVANNTLKQLMDWAMIMQEADFANSSFVRSTVATDDASVSAGKDRRIYANKVPNVEGADVLSEENRLTAVVTEVAPKGDAGTETEEANVLDTTFVPSTEKSARPASSMDAGAGELEDFGFEDRSSTTTMANDVVGGVGVNVVPTTTRRTYEVSENVDESAELVRNHNTPMVRTSTTSQVASSGMAFEDVPVTTYSPSSPILRRTEQTTPPIPLTTMITRITTTMPVRRPVTTQDTSSFTTTDVPARDTTLAPASVAITTTMVSGPSSEQPLLQETTGSRPLNQESTESSEINFNLLNRTEKPETSAVSTMAPMTTVVPNLSTATLSNNVDTEDSRDAGESLIGQLATGVSTERSDVSPGTTTTEDAADEEVGKGPIVVDEKNAYDTVTTTLAPITTSTTMSTPTTTAPSSGQPGVVGISSEAFTTRRTIDRSMTTTELSEEESVTEEDYIELNNASNNNNNGGSGQSQPKAEVVGEPKQVDGTTEQSLGEPADEGDNSVVVAVVASIVSVIVVLLLIAAFIVFRKRQNQVSYGQRCRPVGLDAYSLDNVSVYNSVRRKGNTARMSKRSYGNSAFEDPNFKTNPLSVAELANIIQNKTAIYDEFKEIPNVTARADEVPEGCEDKNRYANVVPLPETRVHLKRLNDDEKTEYINANFVKGPKDSANYYIACQAPMENTINDFWRMIWEQNSKVIIMATDLSENGVEKCAEYLPPSVVLDNSRTFGDFQLTLKSRENKEKYTISTVHMRHGPSNNLREIMHFWYQWPDTGVPIDESSIIGMLLEARTHLKLSPSELAEFATIAEEENDTTPSKAEPQVAANGTESSNNNNNNNNATSNGTAGKEPTSIVSNGGTNTMDKHKSLQRTQGPLTVHCSPGTGRTGTLVACDIALRLLEVPPRTVDVPQIVYYVRRGRASAVRTREQYELIYRVANVYATKLTGPTIET
ncbi:AGAP003976-PA-like protein [Anopheles sinensis]|uniref:AGAP003976-PA-like protein n=1 Tax=Anopheles sinensis TaxID=74873 RepID=A0A084W5A3_ANOSI|nr:AGAP003976-PA-like protein [Anopheles sinensis]